MEKPTKGKVDKWRENEKTNQALFNGNGIRHDLHYFNHSPVFLHGAYLGEYTMILRAIQIRYLAATDTQGVRLKAFTDAGALTEPRQYEANLDQQALSLAERYILKQGWHSYVTGLGELPNGDYIATMNHKD